MTEKKGKKLSGKTKIGKSSEDKSQIKYWRILNLREK